MKKNEDMCENLTQLRYEMKKEIDKNSVLPFVYVYAALIMTIDVCPLCPVYYIYKNT